MFFGAVVAEVVTVAVAVNFTVVAVVVVDFAIVVVVVVVAVIVVVVDYCPIYYVIFITCFQCKEPGYRPLHTLEKEQLIFIRITIPSVS